MRVCFKTEKETNKHAQKEIKAPEAASPAACLISVDGCPSDMKRQELCFNQLHQPTFSARQGVFIFICF